MRRTVVVLTLLALVVVMAGTAVAQQTEQEILKKYLAKTEKKHVMHQGWVSLSFAMNRINRHNDYNDFANYSTDQMTGSSFSWLNMAKAFGAEFGVSVNRRFGFAVGGEYWTKMGETMTGSYEYQPISTAVSDPKSEIKTYGGFASLTYYVTNPPTPQDGLKKLALRTKLTVGYYQTKWDLWPEYQNLNLSTALPEQSNLTYSGSAPAIALTLGGDYPLGSTGFCLGTEFGYQYLNFSNVSWYNDQDQEIVVTYAGTVDSRVDLAFSGVIGRIELKKFFKW